MADIEISTPPRRRFPRMPALTWAGITLGASVLGLAVLGPLLMTHDPYQFSIAMNRPPSFEHWLGTDDQGHDIYSRLIAGTGFSLLFGAGAALLALAIGGLAALIAVALGRWTETVIFAGFDLIRALPGILFALAFVAAFEPGAGAVILALGISFSPNFAVIARATFNEQMSRTYTRAAFVLGAGRLRIALVHVLPNIAGALITQFAIILPRCIVLESVLSFLGLGVSPQTPTWGRMIANATRYTEDAPHAILVPILALSVTTFAMALIGDALRQHIDPARRRIAL